MRTLARVLDAARVLDDRFLDEDRATRAQGQGDRVGRPRVHLDRMAVRSVQVDQVA